MYYSCSLVGMPDCAMFKGGHFDHFRGFLRGFQGNRFKGARTPEGTAGPGGIPGTHGGELSGS